MTMNPRTTINFLVITLLLWIGFYFGFLYGPAETRQMDGLVNALGLFLLAKILSDFLYRVTTKPRDDEKQAKRISDFLDQKIDATIPNSMKSGFQGINVLDMKEVLKRLESGDTLWWLSTFDPHPLHLIPSLKAALKADIKINMLIINPHSASFSNRVDELQHSIDKEQCFKQCESFIAEMEKVRTENPAKFNIAYYSDSSCAPIFIIQKPNMLVGWSSYYLCKPIAIAFPFFHWVSTATDPFIGNLFEYVKYKWEKNKTHTHPRLSGSELYRNEAVLARTASKNPICGQWIYKLDVDGLPVFGEFEITFDSGSNALGAEGNAWYYGRRPEESNKRGTWFSDQIFMNANSIAIIYEMTIANRTAREKQEGIKNYKGILQFRLNKGENCFEGTLGGIGNSLQGNARAFRWPGNQPFCPEKFEQFFKEKFGEDIVPDKLLPAATM